MQKDKIRLLLVDDSQTIRKSIRYGLHTVNPDIIIISEAINGVEAIQMAHDLKPDIILMDLNMPGISGIEATRSIMADNPIPILIFTAVSNPEEISEEGLTALQAGAVMIFKKPAGYQIEKQLSEMKKLARIIKAMSEIKVTKRIRTTTKNLAPTLLPPGPGEASQVIFIGASTGGPTILSTILGKMPATYPYPIVVAQHMSSRFVDNFARWLDKEISLKVTIAKDGESLFPGRVYVPPKETHFGFYPSKTIRIIPHLDEKKVCPNIDILFYDAARYFKQEAIGIILTGMGKDGAVGLKQMREQNSITIAQDQESCVVFGMPSVAIKSKAVEFIFTPDEISQYLLDIF